MTKPHIMILAGEASGDAHAAEFIEQLKQINPDIRLTGMGSHSMRKAGVDLIFDSASIAVMGLVEVIKHWGDIKHAMNLVKAALEDSKPDLLVLVDYPEFNLKMARHARSLGIKVLFYISPQIWAWRPKRIHKIGRSIDHMAVIFKFETEYYHRANIPVSFVGNPLVDKVKSSIPAAEMRSQLGIEIDAKVVGLFPGSRKAEILNLLPLMFDTAQLLLLRKPNLTFVMPVANSLDFQNIEQQCQQSRLNIILTRDDIYDVIPCCDAIICCSGTVTLEIALLEVPMCIIYKMSWLSYQIMSRLITIPHIGLANIIANRLIVQEYLQNDATKKNISSEVLKILDDEAYRQQVIMGLSRVKENLGEGNGARNMARLVLSFVQ
ncbi:MAG: lipid-A-disaccharide synthase [Gammaproteobacteria bacterium]|nr:lipid-A-disaccharide synthase [Gammaproteobacteria bacterium]